VEVVVYDDASTDASVEVVRSFGDGVRLERGVTRAGPNVARARLVAASRGEWLQFLDADDLLLPGKLAWQVAFAQREGADLVISPGRRESGEVVNAPISDDAWVNLFHFGLGVIHGNLWRKATIVDAGGWVEDDPLGHEDYRMLFAVLRGGARVAYDNEPRAVYRAVNPSSVSATHGAVAGYRDFCLLLGRWTAEMDRASLLTPERRHEAALSALRFARRLWHMDRRAAREAARVALAIEPDLLTAMRSQWPAYSSVFRNFGFGAAERYDAAASRLRSLLGRKRTDSGGTWS
jgi:glycosyltransferase involved in cell wall biosynthesis